jgi:hypothetical protein
LSPNPILECLWKAASTGKREGGREREKREREDENLKREGEEREERKGERIGRGGREGREGEERKKKEREGERMREAEKEGKTMIFSVLRGLMKKAWDRNKIQASLEQLIELGLKLLGQGRKGERVEEVL